MAVPASVDLFLEVGTTRVFAGALDWPGWCRGGRDEEAAIENLLAYQDRYAAVVDRGGVPFIGNAPEFAVGERLKGGSGTDFGVPGVAAAADARPLDAAELERQSLLLRACWEAFDQVVAVARATQVELRKGPRGGGRDLDKIEAHVLEAEVVYLSQLGSRSPRPPTPADVRETALAALAAGARGDPVATPSKAQRPWSPRYFVRRAAWHVLDHAWEIEDRST